MNDNRLLACAQLCMGERAVDVGTDHGHLAEYLIKAGICESCIACDINEMPLASARETVARAQLGSKIEVVLSNGLDEICSEGVSDVVIAGMGGELIADIISRADWLKANKVGLILQPMTKWDYLRKYLYNNNFQIVQELACQDGRFVYSVMRAVYSDEKLDYPCDMAYLHGGKVCGDSEVGKLYLHKQADRLETAGKGMRKSEDKADLGRLMLDTARQLKNKCEK